MNTGRRSGAEFGSRDLLGAIRAHRIPDVRACLAQGASVRSLDPTGMNAAQSAVRRAWGYLARDDVQRTLQEIIAVLAESDAEAFLAAQQGGARRGLRPELGRVSALSALAGMARRSRTHVLDIIERCSVGSLEDHERTQARIGAPLGCVAAREGEVEVLCALSERLGARVLTWTDAEGMDPFDHALARAQPRALECLMERGARMVGGIVRVDLGRRGILGMCDAPGAAPRDKAQCVDVVFARGADPLACDPQTGVGLAQGAQEALEKAAGGPMEPVYRRIIAEARCAVLARGGPGEERASQTPPAPGL